MASGGPTSRGYGAIPGSDVAVNQPGYQSTVGYQSTTGYPEANQLPSSHPESLHSLPPAYEYEAPQGLPPQQGQNAGKQPPYNPVYGRPDHTSYQPQQAAHPPAPQYQGIPSYPQQPPMGAQYAPAPPMLQQQTNTNVVVVGQPGIYPHTTVHVVPQAKTYLTLTTVLMVICFIHGNLPAFLCLVPALICALTASSHNDAGDLNGARNCGNMALFCNILMVVYYICLVITGIIILALFLTDTLIIPIGPPDIDN